MVAIVLDILIVLILVINIFIGYKKGLIKLAVSLVAVLISVIITLVLYKPISNLIINNTEIDEKIESSIIESATSKQEDTENLERDTEKEYNEIVEKYLQDAVIETKDNIVESAAGTLSVKIINIVSMIMIFIVARLILILLIFVADTIAKLPILKQFNEIGGIAYGAIKGLIIIYVLLAILFFIVYMTNNTQISEIINQTFITKVMYNKNLILNIIF